MVARFVDADNGAKPENTLTMRSVGKKREDMSDVLPPFVFFFFFRTMSLIWLQFLLFLSQRNLDADDVNDFFPSFRRWLPFDPAEASKTS